jgi:(R,R)-butanediol dehydrogenase/meso-butanediol dehydrogenase/diacetyl reductase
MRPFIQRYQPGTILGHEFSGMVVAKGAEVTRLAVGDRITSMGIAGCGRCETCRGGAPIWCSEKRTIQGGFAEYVLANEYSSFRLPEQLNFVEGALLEPLACAWHALDLAQMRRGARVLVIGAGVTGLGVALFARRQGAGRIAVTARSAERSALAVEMGATAFLPQGPDLREAAVEALGGAPDYVFECVGAPGLIEQAITCVAPRGTVVVSGLCLEPQPIVSAVAVFKELRVQYCMAYRLSDFEAVSDVMLSAPGKTMQLVTSEIGLEEFPEMFESLRGRNRHCKVIVAAR